MLADRNGYSVAASGSTEGSNHGPQTGFNNSYDRNTEISSAAVNSSGSRLAA